MLVYCEQSRARGYTCKCSYLSISCFSCLLQFDMGSAFFSRLNSKLPGDVVLPRTEEESDEKEEVQEEEELKENDSSPIPPPFVDDVKTKEQKKQQKASKKITEDDPKTNQAKEFHDTNTIMTKASSPRNIPKVYKPEQSGSQQREYRVYQRHYYQAELPPRLQKKAAENRLFQQNINSSPRFVRTAAPPDHSSGPEFVNKGEKLVSSLPAGQKQFVKVFYISRIT